MSDKGFDDLKKKRDAKKSKENTEDEKKKANENLANIVSSKKNKANTKKSTSTKVSTKTNTSTSTKVDPKTLLKRNNDPSPKQHSVYFLPKHARRIKAMQEYAGETKSAVVQKAVDFLYEHLRDELE